MVVAALAVLSGSASVEFLYCSECHDHPIEAPTGVTPRTRFVCRTCCRRLAREKNIPAARQRSAYDKNPISDEAVTDAESIAD
jgi:hypothetical protein